MDITSLPTLQQHMLIRKPGFFDFGRNCVSQRDNVNYPAPSQRFHLFPQVLLVFLRKQFRGCFKRKKQKENKKLPLGEVIRLKTIHHYDNYWPGDYTHRVGSLYEL